MFEKLKKCYEQIQAVRKAIAQLGRINPLADKAITDMKTVTEKGTSVHAFFNTQKLNREHLVLPWMDARVDFTVLKLV